ncbi:hypothetical protein SAZ11_48095 [Streptomyces sp. FXJ1.4098]|nr:hypothetical protein [Streptomyces sp. FXJ1.4098]
MSAEEQIRTESTSQSGPDHAPVDGRSRSGRPGLADWMSGIKDSVSITDLSIPGTHESGALHPGLSMGYAQCQEEALDWQLDSGVRFLRYSPR